MISSIDITFCEDQAPAVIFTALLEVGWQFDKCIRYELYADVSDAGLDVQTSDLSEVDKVTKAFSDALTTGKKASLQLSWPEVVYVDCTFFSLTQLQILFFAGPPLRQGCGRFTDFSWLLLRIACPLYEAGCAIFTLTCTDHFD